MRKRTPSADRARDDLAAIFAAAIAAVDPERLVAAHLIYRGLDATVTDGGNELARWRGPTLCVGAGKAAARMAAGCEDALGTERVRGLVIVPDGCDVPLSTVTVAQAGHPIPDFRGANATDHVCRLIASAPTGPVLCLISGGASSLLVGPRAPVTLKDKMHVNRLLLASGADINDMNTVRKHLSETKGGGLLRLGTARPIVTLVLSDVVGDDPSIIGSGPTTPDPTTYADAQAVLRRAKIDRDVPDSVHALLARGVQGDAPETVKPHDPQARDRVTVVIGSNRTALAAAAQEAARIGYTPVVATTPITGDSRRAAHRWLRSVRNQMARSSSKPCCVIAGGETTAQVTGGGRGGRNQEFALALTRPLSGAKIAVLSAGTDGVDGPTDAAGAFVDGSTLTTARQYGLDPDAMLHNNDSYTFFQAIGGLFRCGPTGTNVTDIKIALPVAEGQFQVPSSKFQGFGGAGSEP